MSKIGYIRVSTDHQETKRQEELMESFGVTKVFSEKISGKSLERPELKKMMEYVRDGDTLYIESISRLSRSARDFFRIVDELTEKGVQINSAKESFDTATPQGRFVLSIFAALSELEREQMLQRQKEGIAVAKSLGKYKGRKPKQLDMARFDECYSLYKADKLTVTDFAKRMGIARSTLYIRLKNCSY